MSNGITDMHREEEKKAWELVENTCENCISKDSQSSVCDSCNMAYCSRGCRPCFIPSQSAIDAKVEELRKEQITTGAKERINKVEGISRFPWTALEMIEKLESERAEMLACLKALVKWNSESPSKKLTQICEDAENIIKKVEGK